MFKKIKQLFCEHDFDVTEEESTRLFNDHVEYETHEKYKCILCGCSFKVFKKSEIKNK